MGFNYLQTDDRDDYFESLGKSRKAKTGYTKYTILKEGVIVISESNPKIKSKVKKLLGLTERFVRRGRWRELVVQAGYELKTEFIKYNTNEDIL